MISQLTSFLIIPSIVNKIIESKIADYVENIISSISEERTLYFLFFQKFS
jgi:hypothetical protein